MLISIILCSTIYFTQNTPLRVGAVPSSWNDTDKPPTPRAFCVMYTSIWKDIPGWEGYYEASDAGLVRSSRKTVEIIQNEFLCTSSKILRPVFDKDCYLTVRLSCNGKTKKYRVQHLIDKTFTIPNPENKPILDHKNGVRWDNRVENLRWVTQSENVQTAYDFGRKTKHGFSISQYDLEGNFVRSYRVIRDVEKHGYSSQCVNRAVLGQRKTAYGFTWKRNSGKEIQTR